MKIKLMKIEGNTLTIDETETIFTINRFSAQKSLNYNLETFDYKNAINFLIEQTKLNISIIEEFIKELDAYVLKNTGAIIKTALGNIFLSF